MTLERRMDAGDSAPEVLIYDALSIDGFDCADCGIAGAPTGVNYWNCPRCCKGWRPGQDDLRELGACLVDAERDERRASSIMDALLGTPNPPVEQGPFGLLVVMLRQIVHGMSGPEILNLAIRLPGAVGVESADTRACAAWLLAHRDEQRALDGSA